MAGDMNARALQWLALLALAAPAGLARAVLGTLRVVTSRPDNKQARVRVAK